MLKEKLRISKELNKISIILIFFLLVSNIILINTHSLNDVEESEEIVYFKETTEDYNKDTKYYATIKYKKFKKLYKAKSLTTIAIIDSKSNVSEMFIEMLNKMAFYKNTKIYTMQLNKLSNKQLIEFYDLDDRLSKLEDNYILMVSDNKILSITTFDEDNINIIEKEIGE